MPDSKGFGGRKEIRSDDVVSLGAIVDDLMRREVFSRGMPVAELAAQWPAVVGERLAAATAPMALEEGVLTVGVSNGPWGAQARFLQDEIRKKADEALGGGRITAIRIIVRNRS
jgi:predicted nucleic acid-binding Zn ribbon protein